MQSKNELTGQDLRDSLDQFMLILAQPIKVELTNDHRKKLNALIPDFRKKFPTLFSSKPFIIQVKNYEWPNIVYLNAIQIRKTYSLELATILNPELYNAQCILGIQAKPIFDLEAILLNQLTLALYTFGNLHKTWGKLMLKCHKSQIITMTAISASWMIHTKKVLPQELTLLLQELNCEIKKLKSI